MEGYDSATYGDSWAEHYDSIFPGPGVEVIDFLAARAGEGPVLELAVGTGRVALPLLGAGLGVDGVEISAGMIRRLREKPGGGEVGIVASDMTDFTVATPYPLILLGFNTLFGALEEERQRAVFQAVAAALQPQGAFVIDCFVPDLDRFDRGQRVQTLAVRIDRVDLEYSIHRPADQRVDTMRELRWTDGGSVLLPVAVRYLWPDQIDAMAGEAGLELAERYEWYDE
ncbi:MAG TPA: class I SAM-dependent methyltransferase, partial [Longimicrobiales bacterium]|nr:class I SAM-dependent methyltransferase [Longimicrobiales bacterium]